MAKGKGRQKVDRHAVAKANGYVRGANREKDQVRNENKYSDESVALQNRVLEDYQKYALMAPITYYRSSDYAVLQMDIRR